VLRQGSAIVFPYIRSRSSQPLSYLHLNDNQELGRRKVPLAAEHRESDEKDKLQREFIQRVKLDRLAGTYSKADEISGLLAISLLNHRIRRNEDWGRRNTILLFPFVSSVTGFNTCIAVSNVGDGPGTQAITSGIVSFYCHGTLPGGESPITVNPTSKEVLQMPEIG